MKLRRSVRIQSQNARRGRSPSYTSKKMDKPTERMARAANSTKRKLSFESPWPTGQRQKLKVEHPSEVPHQEKPKPYRDMSYLSGITPLPSCSYGPATFGKNFTDYIKEQNCRKPTETFTSNNAGILETLLQQNQRDHDYTNLYFNKGSDSESTLSASESEKYETFDSVDTETSNQVSEEPGRSNISSTVLDTQVPNQIDSVYMEISSQINQVFEEVTDSKPVSSNISSTVVNMQVSINQTDLVYMETLHQVNQVSGEGLDNEPGPSNISSTLVDTQVPSQIDLVDMETSCQVNPVFEEPGPSNIPSTIVDTQVPNQIDSVDIETSSQINQVFEEVTDSKPVSSNISSTIVETQISINQTNLVYMETSRQVNQVFEEDLHNESGPSNISSTLVDTQVPSQIDLVDMETSCQVNPDFEEPGPSNISSTIVDTEVPNQINSVDIETSSQINQVFEEVTDSKPVSSNISSTIVETQISINQTNLVYMETSRQVNQVFEEDLHNESGPSNISSTLVDTQVPSQIDLVDMETSCQVNPDFEEPGPSNISSTIVDTEVPNQINSVDIETSSQINQVFEEVTDSKPVSSNISSTVVETHVSINQTDLVYMETSCQVNQVFEEDLNNESGPSNISSTVVDTQVPSQIDLVHMETSCQVNQVFKESGPSNIPSTVLDTEVPNQIDSVDIETSSQINQVFEEGAQNKPVSANISATDGAFNEDNSNKGNQSPRSLIVFLNLTDTEPPNEEADQDRDVSYSETDMNITNETYQAVEEGNSDQINQSFDASPEPSIVFFDITAINLAKIVLFNIPDMEAPNEDASEKADCDKENQNFDAIKADVQTPTKTYHQALTEAGANITNDLASSNNSPSLIDLKVSNQNNSHKENRSIEGPSNMSSTEADMDQPLKQDGLDKENKNYSPKKDKCAGKALAEESSVTKEDDSDKENQSSCANNLRRSSEVVAKSEEQETGEGPVNVEVEVAALPDDLRDITVRPELYYNIFNIGLEVLLHVYGVNGTDTFDALDL